MAHTNISGISFTMNHEFNLSASSITMKGKEGVRPPDLRGKPVVLPIPVSSMIPGLLGALPAAVNPETAGISPVAKAGLAAAAVASRVSINSSAGGYDLGYLPSLLKVTDGAYPKKGALSEQELEMRILTRVARMTASAGPARNTYSQLLKQATEAAALPASLKGFQQNCCMAGASVNLD